MKQEVDSDVSEGGDRSLVSPPLAELLLHEPLHGVDHPVWSQAPKRVHYTEQYTTLHSTLRCTVHYAAQYTTLNSILH